MLVAAMVAGLEIDFTWVLITMIHEKAFMMSTSYLFDYLVFLFFKKDGVQISHCDTLHSLAETVDIDLIMDKANVAATQIGRRINMSPLRDNLVDTVELDQGANPVTTYHTDTTLASSIHASSKAPTSSCSTTICSSTISCATPEVGGSDYHPATPHTSVDA